MNKETNRKTNPNVTYHYGKVTGKFWYKDGYVQGKITNDTGLSKTSKYKNIHEALNAVEAITQK